MPSTRVAILGAGGFVSQRMQQRLANHPWFDLVAIAGQDSGRMLTTVPWRLEHNRPEALNNISEPILDVHSPDLHHSLKSLGVTIVFSALPSIPAHTIEALLSRNGLVVFSNASAYRMHQEVPLVVADVNPESLKQWPGKLGLLACATNCTLIPVLHPLHIIAKHHTVTRVMVRSEQALSGAGWTLLLDDEKRRAAIGNEIEGEAEKLIEEAERILQINAEWDVVCKRVDAEEGHIVNVELELEQNVTYEEIKSLLLSQKYNHLIQLPSAPATPIILLDESPTRAKHLWGSFHDSNPNPSQNLVAGMETVVHIEAVEGPTIKFKALSHNTIRGAAGGVLLLAELAVAEGEIPSVDINPSKVSSER
jgi:aspartate-semialdehyde dehydrogenase